MEDVDPSQLSPATAVECTDGDLDELARALARAGDVDVPELGTFALRDALIVD